MNDTETKVIEIISKQMGVAKSEITRDTHFRNDLNLDSLDEVELIMEVEEEFCLLIPDEEAQKLQTVGRAIDYINTWLPPASGRGRSEEVKEYFEHARREMFPKLKESALSLMILGEPDPKLCLELGAAILFDKPILVVVPRGRKVPLALRTIANKIVEVGEPFSETDQANMTAAIKEMVEASDFRG